jgi:glycosyltransferase involved in cell wall biosynthesis
MGCTVRFVPLGVNIDKFTPVDSDRKGELRAKYGVGKEDFIALHVGHMNQGRNIRALEQIQDSGNQVLIAGSTFFPHDAALIRDLEAHGIRFLTGYIDHIEEIYQLADCYVFPTLSERACISQPLSMLEAMACNLPVVSTKFGGVPDLFPDEEGGLLYVENTSELAAKVSYIREAFRHISPRTREMVAQYSWDRSVREILRLVEESLSPATTASNTGDNARRLG